jgi:hypothetical protein
LTAAPNCRAMNAPNGPRRVPPTTTEMRRRDIEGATGTRHTADDGPARHRSRVRGRRSLALLVVHRGRRRGKRGGVAPWSPVPIDSDVVGLGVATPRTAPEIHTGHQQQDATSAGAAGR